MQAACERAAVASASSAYQNEVAEGKDFPSVLAVADLLVERVYLRRGILPEEFSERLDKVQVLRGPTRAPSIIIFDSRWQLGTSLRVGIKVRGPKLATHTRLLCDQQRAHDS